MSSVDCSTDYSDNEYSSDSGCSSLSSPRIVQDSLTFPQPIYATILVPVFRVESIPCPDIVINNDSPATVEIPSKRRLIKWSLPPPVQPAVPLPGWSPMPYGLEIFWQSAFSWFFQPFSTSHGHLWTLEPTELPPVSVEWPWHTATYLTKVRFQCQCKRAWTSMKGQAVFWFRVRRQGDEIISEALFKLYGQQCIYCTDPSADEFKFLTPLWYPEEIENGIRFLACQVTKFYYGGVIDNLPVMSNERCRKNQPKKNSLVFHDFRRCQACKNGVCTTLGIF